MKAATAAMLLLAVLVAAAAAMSPPAAVDHQPAAGEITGTLRGRGHHSRDVDDSNHRSSSGGGGDDQSPPLTELALCMTSCGSNATVCMIKCYEPLLRGKVMPVTTPICLLACTTQVMRCATKCPSDIAD